MKTGYWFRTNDDCTPIQISIEEVSKYGIIIMYKRKIYDVE